MKVLVEYKKRGKERSIILIFLLFNEFIMDLLYKGGNWIIFILILIILLNIV